MKFNLCAKFQAFYTKGTILMFVCLHENEVPCDILNDKIWGKYIPPTSFYQRFADVTKWLLTKNQPWHKICH